MIVARITFLASQAHPSACAWPPELPWPRTSLRHRRNRVLSRLRGTARSGVWRSGRGVCGLAYQVFLFSLGRGKFFGVQLADDSKAALEAASVNRFRCARTESVIFFTVRSNASVRRLAGRSVLAIVAPIKLAFRCDSSSHRDFTYMVAGGVAFQTRRYADISVAIQGIKNAAGIRSEMKWAKFRGGERTSAYEGVVDFFFSLIEQNQKNFHRIIAEFGKFSHGAFEGGTPESSVAACTISCWSTGSAGSIPRSATYGCIRTKD